MLDFTKAKKVYINGRLVASLNFGETSQPIFIDKDLIVTFTVLDTYKVKVQKGDLEEIYNLSCERNTSQPYHYGDIEFVGPDGDKAYLALTNYKGSFGQEGEIKYNNKWVSNGWYSDVDQSGDAYSTTYAKYYKAFIKGEYFGYPLQVRLETYPLDERLIDDAIERVNKGLPTFHMTRTTAQSDSYCQMGDYEDTWLAAAWTYSTYAYIKFNQRTLTPYYGEYVYDKNSLVYKKWLDTAVHEIGHTIGWDDQATHTPSVYDYSRNRTKGAYFQANDIAWLKHAFVDGYGVNPAVFDVDRKGSADEPMMSRARVAVPPPDDSNVKPEFDFAYFDNNDELEEQASNILTAKLTYDRTETLNIGGDVEIEYNIYTIIPINEEKGTLSKKELKVPSTETFNPKQEQSYRLYLQQYEKTPCSLVSIRTGIVEV